MFYINIDDELQLKLLTESDASDFFNLIEENRSYLHQYMPRISENKSVEDTKKVIELFLQQLIDRSGFRTGIVYKGQLVGIVGLKYIDWINKKSEIMCWVGQKFSGKGIGTRAQKKVIQITFEHYGLNKLIGKPSVHNSASIRMLEKSGFIFEGVAQQEELLPNGYTDISLYCITKQQYEENIR